MFREDMFDGKHKKTISRKLIDLGIVLFLSFYDYEPIARFF